jgi:hypothetical protein
VANKIPEEIILMNSLKKRLLNIVDEAAVLGLNEKDIKTAKSFGNTTNLAFALKQS